MMEIALGGIYVYKYVTSVLCKTQEMFNFGQTSAAFKTNL